MTIKPDAAPVRVHLLALPETTAGAIHGLYEVFSAVGVTWTELTGEPAAGPRIEVRIVGHRYMIANPPPAITIVPQLTLEQTGPAEVIIVTDLNISMNTDPRGRWSRETAWVRERFEEGATLCSVCTGSVFLAETGLLDGQEATTHWCTTGLFQRWYPAVRLRPERILSPAGDGHRIVTSGGATSWEDLALYLIARYCGTTEALRIAKIFVLGDRSEGQLPYAAAIRQRRDTDAVIGACQAWVAEHYEIANPVAGMVRHSGLPERTFKRRFKLATGYTPLEYVQTLRIEEAKHLLETTRMPTDAVAQAVGYDDPTFFRRLFKRRVGVTPARYRQRVQSVLDRTLLPVATTH